MKSVHTVNLLCKFLFIFLKYLFPVPQNLRFVLPLPLFFFNQRLLSMVRHTAPLILPFYFYPGLSVSIIFLIFSIYHDTIDLVARDSSLTAPRSPFSGAFCSLFVQHCLFNPLLHLYFAGVSATSIILLLNLYVSLNDLGLFNNS